jgi:hypothetical protein
MTTKLEQMWAALKDYQPQADAAWHGSAWARMCSERTAAAANAAAYAANAANANAAAVAAADAAYAAAADAVAAADAAYAAQGAIKRIKAITTTPTAAQPAPVQEPVAWPCLIDSANFSANTITLVMQCEDYKVSARKHWLSTTPPQRPWVGLTNEEKQEAYYKINLWNECVAFIEAKLKEKNT